MIKIICDSMSDVPKEIIQKYNIEVLPLTIMLNDNEYEDGINLTNNDFYKMLRESESIPKTSQVTYAKFIKVFEKYKGIDVLYISGSSSASGTYQSAVLAKSEGYDNVRIFDTKSLSIGSGLFVVKACEMIEQGYSIDEILDKLENLKGKESVLFSVNTLEYLSKGGRISSTKAKIGNLLNIKPVLGIEEGLVSLKTQVRGTKQMYLSLINGVLAEHKENLESKTIIIACGDNEEDIVQFKKMLLEKYNVSNVYFKNIGCAICSHSGPEIIGISCI